MNNQNNNELNMSNSNLANNTNMGVNNNVVNGEMDANLGMQQQNNSVPSNESIMSQNQQSQNLNSAVRPQNMGFSNMSQGGQMNSDTNTSASMQSQSLNQNSVLEQNQMNINSGIGMVQSNNMVQGGQMNLDPNAGGTIQSQQNMAFNNMSQPNNVNNQVPGNGISNTPQKKSNKKIIIIAFIAILVIVCVVLVVMLINKDNSNNSSSNTNEYEEDNIVNNTSTDSLDTISFQGFEFKKVGNYSYLVKDDQLTVTNDNYAFILGIFEGSFDSLKQDQATTIATLQTSLADSGYAVGDITFDNILGTDILVGEMSIEGVNVLYYVFATTNNSYSYVGMAISKTNTYDRESLNELLTIVKDTKYVGGVSSYSKEFSKSFDMSGIE